jgi:predicted XRE-type DNA-binding protein
LYRLALLFICIVFTAVTTTAHRISAGACSALARPPTNTGPATFAGDEQHSRPTGMNNANQANATNITINSATVNSSSIASPVSTLSNVQSPATPHLSLHSPQLQDATHPLAEAALQLAADNVSLAALQSQQMQQALQQQAMNLQQSPQTSNGTSSVEDQLQQVVCAQQQMQTGDQQPSQSSTPSGGQSSSSTGTGYFTIEQIEMVRRLRNSGLTVGQFMDAYKEMDRLDRELTFDKNELLNDSTATSITQALNSMVLPTPNSYGSASGYSAQSGIYFNYQNNQNSYVQPGQTHHLHPFSDDVSAQELLEFKKKGEPSMMMEIRNFVSKYNIRQQMIAEMTHISQGYISTFFHGEKMSEKRKNIIYQWYLTYSKDPSRLVRDHASMTMASHRLDNDGASDGQDSSLLFPVTRRDRFIFRKQHLKILEHYFKENPYPEIHAKEQIVEECNQQAERIAGKALKESDKVTVSIVSNWFNNRRKNVRSRQVKQLTQAANGLGLLNSPSISMQHLMAQQQQHQNAGALSSVGSHDPSSSSASVVGMANMSAQAIAASTSAYLQQNSGSQVNTGNPLGGYGLGAQLNGPQSSQQAAAHAHALSHQQSDASFDSNYAYDCSYSNESTPPTAGPAGSTTPMQLMRAAGAVAAAAVNAGQMQFKTEPYDQFLAECFDKVQSAVGGVLVKPDRDAEMDSLHHEHEESSISEFSSQASFNGNDSID